MSAVLFVLWLLLVTASVGIGVASDLFQGDAPVFPLLPLLLTKAALDVWAVVASHLRGVAGIDGYHVFQIFGGGDRFLALQMTGSLLVFAGLLSSMVYYTVPVLRYGVLSALTACTGVGHMLLLGSLSYFQEGNRSVSIFTASPNREFFMGGAVVLFGAGCVAAIEALPTAASLLSVTGLVAHGLGVTIAHVWVGWMHAPRYRLFMPLPGGVKQFVAQTGTWTVVGVATYLLLVVLITSPDTPQGWGWLACGTMLLGDISLLMFARFVNLQSRVPDSATFLSANGCFTVSLAAVLHFAAYVVLAVSLDPTLGVRVPLLDALEGVRLFQRLAMSTLLALPIVTQTLGGVVHSGNYDPWPPMNGGRLFVVVQCAGWISYAVGCAALLLHCTAIGEKLGILSASALMFAQLLLHQSVHVFVPRRQSRSTALDLPPFLNGEWVVGFVMLVGGVMIFLFCDVIGAHEWRPTLVLVASVLSVLPTPIAHLSARDRIPAFMPFQGCGEFIALQAVGWLLYSGHLVYCVTAVVGAVRAPATQSVIVCLVPYILISLSLTFEFEAPRRLQNLERLLYQVEDVALRSELIDEIRQYLPSLCAMEVSIRTRNRRSEVRILRLLVLLLLVGTLTCFSVASWWYFRNRAVAFAMACCGLVVSLLSVGAVHGLLGPAMHGAAFQMYMPFRGGTAFLTAQAFGWWATATAILLVALYHLQLSTTERVVFPLAGLTSAAGQSLLYLSLSLFNDAADAPTMFVGNAEGVVAALIIMCAVGVSHLYESFIGSGAVDGMMLLITTSSMALAIPLGAVGLRKSIARMDDALEDEVKVPAVLSTFFLTLQYGAVLLFAALPLLMMYVVYFAAHSYGSGVLALLSWKTVTPAAAAMLVAAMIAGERKIQLATQYAWEAILCYALYLVPVYTVGGGYMYLYAHRCLGLLAYMLTMNFLVVAPPQLRFLALYANAMLLGWVLYQMTGILSGEPPYSPVDGTLNIAFTAGCTWYTMYRYKGRPEVTGILRSPRFMKFIRRHFSPGMSRYFDLKVINDGEKLWPGRNYLFGYHPHGIFPGTMVWAILSKAWTDALGTPTHHVCMHSATVIFNVPLLRDFNLAMSGLVVSRSGIQYNLEHGHSSILVPGGQAEMLHSRMSRTELHLITYHRGFVRLAMQQKVPLVPILCMGEINLMSNVSWPRVQRFFLKLIGFGLPVVPMGRAYLPIPLPEPLTIVVGRPLLPEEGHGDANVADDVRRYADAYFASVKALFYKYRATCGYPTMELILHQKE